MCSSFFSRKCFTGLIAGIVLAIPALQAFAESTHVTEGSQAASEGACVAPTDEIRRYHMDNLVHGRDEVVIAGDRSGKYSLAGCVDCHAAKDDTGGYVPINSEGQFCESCHNFLAVNLACFQCHRTTPDPRNQRIGATDLDRLDYQQLNASRQLELHESPGLYAIEPAGIQRD
jgi:hypothetical protein